MVRMTRNLWHTGKVFTMDSGFCVSCVIVQLHLKGVYGQALIKKRGRYWASFVPGDHIDDHFKDKRLGEVETLKQEIDGVPFYIHCQKDDGYVTKIMSTHGCISLVEDHETRRQSNDGSYVHFKYPQPISRHNWSKHWVDDANNCRHDTISLSDTWRTKYWPNVAETNAFSART